MKNPTAKIIVKDIQPQGALKCAVRCHYVQRSSSRCRLSYDAAKVVKISEICNENRHKVT